MTMTAKKPGSSAFEDRPRARRWWNRQAFSRTDNTDVALMIGALSIICFWAPVVGAVLGIFAVLVATWADRSPLLTGERAPRSDAMLAYGSGILGLLLGIGFSFMVLPNW